MYRQCNIWMPCKGTRRLDRNTCVFYQQCQQFLVWRNIRSETKAIIEMQCMIFRKRSYLIPWNFYQMIPRTQQGWYQSEIFMTSYLHFSWVSTDQRRWAPNQITRNTYFERGFQGTGLCDRLRHRFIRALSHIDDHKHGIEVSDVDEHSQVKSQFKSHQLRFYAMAPLNDKTHGHLDKWLCTWPYRKWKFVCLLSKRSFNY